MSLFGRIISYIALVALAVILFNGVYPYLMLLKKPFKLYTIRRFILSEDFYKKFINRVCFNAINEFLWFCFMNFAMFRFHNSNTCFSI